MRIKVAILASIACLIFQESNAQILDRPDQILAFGIAKPKSREFYAPEPPAEEPVLPDEVDQWEERVPQEISPGIYGDFIDVPPEFEEPKLSETSDPDLWIPYRIPHFSSPDAAYRLRVGDSLTLAVYGETKTAQTVTVDPQGCISYLYASRLYVVGKTLFQLRQDLERELKKYFRHALVAITPVKFGADFYTVMGQVRLAGKQPIVGKPTLLKALCQAQGFNLIDYREQIWDMCDLEKAFVSRRGEYVPVDFAQLVKGGDVRQNILLEAGDFVYIPDRTVKQVFVLGEVANQKSVDYFTDMSLIEALADAGSISQRASNRVVVLRGSLSCPVQFVIDYKRIARGLAPNFALCPGDIVYVPPRKLYLLKEIVQSAIAAFVFSVSYEAGLEQYMRCDPGARAVFGDNPVLP